MAGFDPSVISQIPDGLPNPAAAKQQAYTLAGQIDEQKLGHLKLQQAQEGMEDQAKAKNILRENPIDFSKPESITKAAEKISKEVNPDYAMKFMRQSQEVLGGQYENQIKDLQVKQEESNLVSQAVDPLVSKLMDMQRAGATPAMLNAASRTESKRVVQDFVEANPKMKPKIDALLKANPNGIDFDTLKTIDQNSKQGTQFYKDRLATYAQQDKDRRETDQEKRTTGMLANMASMVSSRNAKAEMQKNAVLEPEDLTFKASQALAGDYRTAVIGLGSTRTESGMQNWKNFSKEFRQQATEEAKSKGYSGAESGRYVAGKIAAFEAVKSEEKAIGTRQAQIEGASTEFYNKDEKTGKERGVSMVALKASEAVPRGDWVPINKLMQTWEKMDSKTPIYKLGQALDSSINVYARAITPVGVPTEAAKARALEKVSTAMSKDALKGVFDIMNQEIAEAQYAPSVVREKIMSEFVANGGKQSGATNTAPKSGPQSTKTIGGKTYVSLGGGKWAEQ